MGKTEAPARFSSDITVTPGTFPAGTITLNADLTIPAGSTLTIPPGWALYLNGHTFTGSVNGTIVGSGIINGTVIGKQSVTIP